MYNFILQIIVITSFGAIVYLLSRALPRLSEEPDTLAPGKPGVVERLMKRLPLQRMDAFFTSFSEKTLRKTRVLILRFENMVSGWIHRLRNGDEKKEAGVKDLFDKN